MLFNSPISIEKVNQIISVLNLNENSKVIEIGCGEGEFLNLLSSSSNSDCLGIDISSPSIEIAKSKNIDLDNKLDFLLLDINDLKGNDDSFDLAICIGSTHAFGLGDKAYISALERMSQLVKRNSLIFIGEGYWKKKPNKEYLDFLGSPTGIYNTHDENIKQAESLNLSYLYSTVSNQDEWDHFEGSYLTQAYFRSIAEPKNDLLKKELERVKNWNKYYHRFGRETMGFGFYLFLKT